MIHDPKKLKSNQSRDKVDLTDGYLAFDAPMLMREDAREDYSEQRFVSPGLAKDRVVVLVWADAEDEPRLISCRQAEPHEEEAYFRAYPQL